VGGRNRARNIRHRRNHSNIHNLDPGFVVENIDSAVVFVQEVVYSSVLLSDVMLVAQMVVLPPCGMSRLSGLDDICI
jgi:hypothetical protein